MLKIDVNGVLGKYDIDEDFLKKSQEKIPGLLEKIEQRKQGFYTDEVLENEDLISDMTAYMQSKSDMEYVVILGIGGSALGGIALQESLAPNTKKNIFFIDNIDPEFIEEVYSKIELEKTLFLVITKSGQTVETISQYLFFREKIIDLGLDIKNHFCVITGEDGFLSQEAEKFSLPIFPVPENVGGRFSVFTPVGLLPALFMGIDVEKLLLGAREMKKIFMNEGEENICFSFALLQHNLLKKGIHQNILYSYSQKFFSISDFYRQLLAESTGKRYDINSNEIFTGLTPINAKGVTDHHSQNQLYIEGPKNSLFCFLETQSFSSELQIPKVKGFAHEENVIFLGEKTFTQLYLAEREAVKQSFQESNIPFLSLSIPRVDSFHIGELLFFFQASIAFLGEMMEINAFDQPGVERTKVITKEILQVEEE